MGGFFSIIITIQQFPLFIIQFPLPQFHFPGGKAGFYHLKYNIKPHSVDQKKIKHTHQNFQCHFFSPSQENGGGKNDTEIYAGVDFFWSTECGFIFEVKILASPPENEGGRSELEGSGEGVR